jgi:hypothetical protein
MMDDFGLYPREEPFDPLGVMLFKALQVIAFLFFLALLAVSPDSKEGKIDTKAEFLITMDWPDNHPDDLDLFVQDPAGNIAWYRHREAGFLTLDRDDRGGANDFIVVNGQKIASPIREEIVTVRGILAGEYTVNISHFVATTSEPVQANVKVQKLNPTAQVIFDNKLTLDHSGDEKTAVRFRLDTEGKVINVNQRPKSLLETFRGSWRNGADLDPRTGVRMRRESSAMGHRHDIGCLRRDRRVVAARAGLCPAALVLESARRRRNQRVLYRELRRYARAARLGHDGQAAGVVQAAACADRRTAFAGGRSRRDLSVGRGDRPG